jgi:cytochrome c
MDRNRNRKRVYVALALAALAGTAFAGESAPAGRLAFERHCQSCHGGTGPAALAIGPDLNGIYGARAGRQPGGTHSRATIDSGIVWDRQTLRDFLSSPRRVVPGAMMPDGLSDRAELESLLDYLETLH